MHNIKQRIRLEWQELWDERIEDKVTAEGVARQNYELLFVDQGTVIKANRDYKPPTLGEIMKQNQKVFGIKFEEPDPRIGGWRKFSKEVLSKQARWHRTRDNRSTTRKKKPRMREETAWFYRR